MPPAPFTGGASPGGPQHVFRRVGRSNALIATDQCYLNIARVCRCAGALQGYKGHKNIGTAVLYVQLQVLCVLCAVLYQSMYVPGVVCIFVSASLPSGPLTCLPLP